MGFSLKDYSQKFVTEFKGDYLKMNVIEQNNAGSLIALAAQDNGEFMVYILTAGGEAIDKLWISNYVDLDSFSLPIDGFHEPLITTCFINDDIIFV